MNRKYLEELGLEKEIIDKIMDKNGEQINNHKTEIATMKNDLKVKEGVIENLNAKVEELGKVDLEAIKEEQFNLGKADGSKEVEIFKKDSALKGALSKFKAKDLDLITKLLKEDAISYEEKDGNYEVKGLEEQIKELQSTHNYLFETEEPKNPDGFRANTGEEHNQNVKQEPQTLAQALKEQYSK